MFHCYFEPHGINHISQRTILVDGTRVVIGLSVRSAFRGLAAFIAVAEITDGPYRFVEVGRTVVR